MHRGFGVYRLAFAFQVRSVNTSRRQYVACAGGLQICISAYDKLLRTVNSAIAQDCSGLAGGCAGGWIQAEVACPGERESERESEISLFVVRSLKSGVMPSNILRRIEYTYRLSYVSVLTLIPSSRCLAARYVHHEAPPPPGCLSPGTLLLPRAGGQGHGIGC